MNDQPEARPAPNENVPRWRDSSTVAAVIAIALPLLAIASAWFLLQQLAPVLRPLLVAIFLAYVLMPWHSRLRKHIGSPASIGVLAGATAFALVLLALSVYASVLGLNDELPLLQKRLADVTNEIEKTVGQAAPWATHSNDDGKTPHAKVAEQASRLAAPLLNVAAEALLEACVVALYLLFLLLEGSRFPDRVRRAYPRERAEEILDIAGQVSSAIVSYLRAKVKSSLVLALPVGLVLWAVGVKFALLWAILAFLCNFIPYIGSVISYVFPVGFAFLYFGIRWEPITAAILLLACQVVSASVIEPMIIGNAMGLSPLLILASLAFWGLLWGIPGMFLAVPLTVIAMIVMDHFEATRPVARLFRGA